MLKLPVGIETFSELQEEEYVYIDKTQYIHKLVNEGKSYFLSRPRRFGKSLLLSTMEELFKGNKKLFKGLYIYDKWDWNEKYPVIAINFGGGEYSTITDLQNTLADILDDLGEQFNIELKRRTLPQRFGELIRKVYEKTNQKVVILIDEYDQPIISNLQSKDLNRFQEDLGSFYQILKVNDKFIKFIFLTGISKFAQVSVFSKLNNLDDLSLIDEFNGICGYSHEDLKSNFQDYIQKLANKFEYSYEDAINEIKAFYDGYSWNGKEKLYNPYSTLLCFKHSEFTTEWFNTGTPTVLAQYPMNTHSIKAFAEPTIVTDDELRNSTTENIRDEIFLFQTGYLTVDTIARKKRNKLYHLKIPNLEVKNALLKNLVKEYSKIPNHDIIEYAEKLLEYVIEENCEKIIETLGNYLSPISNEIRGKDERYYHALIFMLLFSAKIHVHNEVHSYKGNADLVIEEENHVIIIEFKQDDKKSIKYMINEAMEQIEEKEYSRQYKNKKIVKGAIVFKKGEIGCKLITQKNL